MGEVWRARHGVHGHEVAVKIDLRSARGGESSPFLHEVAAIAGLDHPNISRILEHGRVGPEGVPGGSTAFPPGVRWLAMELARGGSIRQRPPRTWSEALHVLRQTLTGLSHAHARGVLHRDIKPANLLLAGPVAGVDSAPEGLLDARVLVSDFGISVARSRTPEAADDSSGTPAYMAPEQIEGLWRELGTWTDLYAVGVLLYRFATGRLPFSGSRVSVLRAHLFTRPPEPLLRRGVPEGVRAILSRALSKRPEDRYRFAAELLEDLEDLESTGSAGFEAHASPEAPTEQQTSASGGSTVTVAVPGRASTGALSLFALRLPRLVGRENQARVLLASLDRARRTTTPHAVLLEGAPGLGRSRLARWVCERSHERGLAEHWFATCDPGDPPLRALERLLLRELKLEGLEPEQVVERLTPLMGASHRARAVQRWLTSGEGARLPLPHRRALIVSVLLARARLGPLVVVLDDVGHDPLAVEVVKQALDAEGAPGCSLLVVFTRAVPAVADLAWAGEHPRVSSVVLEPLDAEAMRPLCLDLGGLAPALARRLEERSAGNPKFAVELVRGWIDSGALVQSPAGYRVDPAAEGHLPDDLAAVWELRLDLVLGELEPAERRGVLAAACLGPSFLQEEWEAVAAALGSGSGADLLGLSSRHGLIVPDGPGRWRFVHAAPREILVERARQEHWQRIHAVIASVLRVHGAEVARLAYHLVEAGEDEAAVDPLFHAVHAWLDRGDLRDVGPMDALQECLDRLEVGPSDGRRGRLELLRATRMRFRGELEAAESALAAIDQAGSLPAPDGRLLRERTRLQQARGDYAGALKLALRAEQAFREGGHPERELDMLQYRAHLLLRQGAVQEAERALQERLADIDAVGWTLTRANARETLGNLALVRGDLQRARPLLDELLALAERNGLAAHRGYALNMLGEWARAANRPEEAARHYQGAAEALGALEDPLAVFPTLNLGVLDVDAGRYQVALGRMRRLLTSLERNPRPVPELYAHTVAFAAEACLGQHDEAAQRLRTVARGVERFGVKDKDIAHLAEAGGTAMRLARHPRGYEALDLAIRQYRALGRDQDVTRLQ